VRRILASVMAALLLTASGAFSIALPVAASSGGMTRVQGAGAATAGPNDSVPGNCGISWIYMQTYNYEGDADIGVQSTGGAILGGDWYINWGDGDTTPGAVPPSGSGIWSAEIDHEYSAKGVYTAVLTGAVIVTTGICSIDEPVVTFPIPSNGYYTE